MVEGARRTPSTQPTPPPGAARAPRRGWADSLAADRLGRKRTFFTGLTVFSAASLLCSLAPNVELLVVFRALQAMGASMMNPVAMSIIAHTFTDPRERAQAVGV